ncbi:MULTISPECIES: spore germination protein [Paenibacillus]|uniref:Spore gernimation protein GerA n=4 Tax=Paenibacillus polymyxa TaxID=1406 RepID=E3EGM4_PAEPS|nr:MULTISPECIES: spore germination protein [Paenibacillus]ADO54663.1 spore gernimation protein GerA [Paenibacillus polymyxa SC2]AZH27918.1 spore germination protein [Paenibacillus sp. M-152]MEE4571078.1 spore germination protein [Paenibacillus polymyxa]WPQ57539.1 spore germination protein [Paenibacillus polymyxa]CCC83569.1 spore germination protein KA [Paenibacillus polymyxa M1]
MWSKIISYLPSWSTLFQAGLALIIPLGIYYINTSIYSFVGSKGAKSKHSSSHPLSNKHNEGHMDQQHEPSSKITGNYDSDLQAIREAIGENSDVHFREFVVKKFHARSVLVFIEGMQDEKLMSKQVLEVLMFEGQQQGQDQQEQPEGISNSFIKESLMPLTQISEVTRMEELYEFILLGHTALLIEGMKEALLVGPPNGAIRSVNEPTSEALLRGPRIGFTEVLSENTSMLRRQGLNKSLELKKFQVGSRIKKDLVIAYIKDIVNPDLLEEVSRRISKIDMDFLPESGYVEQLIEDNYLSPFQQAHNTERPDRVINALLEGRIAILLDGTPFALIVPVTFSMLLQSPEDYYERWIPGTLLRLLRFSGAFIALMGPALYISFISFHPGLIPTKLVISIIGTRQGVPFPSVIEVMILEISIEILREAGIRLPKPIGPAMGIVGGLVIGDAAVNAGIVSPFLVIVVAVTAISSFSIPTYSAGITLRLLRFVGMFFAAMLGMFGTILFFLLICIHLTKLKSFGVPYVTPFSPMRLSDWKDLYIRAPMSLMKRRPVMMKTQQRKRRS